MLRTSLADTIKLLTNTGKITKEIGGGKVAREKPKNIFKRYLLWGASDTFNTTYIWVMFPCLGAALLGILLVLLTENYSGALLAMLAIIGIGICIGTIQNWLAKKNVSFKTERSCQWARPKGIFLRTDNGAVVDYGNPLWGKENTHWVLIPEEQQIYQFAVPLATISFYPKNGKKLKAQINVLLGFDNQHKPTEGFSLNGFDLQEIANKVVSNGHKRVKDWIAKHYKEQILRTPVLRALVYLEKTGYEGTVWEVVETTEELLDLPKYPLMNLTLQRASVEFIIQ